MRKLGATAIIALAVSLSWPAAAAESGGPDDAVALTKKAIAELKANPPEKVYADITNKDPRFLDRDLYVIITDMGGKALAHGVNAKLVGKDASENQDADGKFYVKERLEMAKTKPAGFWLDYKFTNPTTKKIEPKSTYCEVVTGNVVCVGIYKK